MAAALTQKIISGVEEINQPTSDRRNKQLLHLKQHKEINKQTKLEETQENSTASVCFHRFIYPQTSVAERVPPCSLQLSAKNLVFCSEGEAGTWLGVWFVD